MSDTSTQNADAPYDPQLAPFIDGESGEVTQIGPDGKRRPISELTGEEQSATRRVEAGEQTRGEAKPDKPGETSSAGTGDKPAEAPKAAANKGQATGS